jgi:hypothetical protein
MILISTSENSPLFIKLIPSSPPGSSHAATPSGCGAIVMARTDRGKRVPRSCAGRLLATVESAKSGWQAIEPLDACIQMDHTIILPSSGSPPRHRAQRT